MDYPPEIQHLIDKHEDAAKAFLNHEPMRGCVVTVNGKPATAEELVEFLRYKPPPLTRKTLQNAIAALDRAFPSTKSEK